ncbi:hypothetical protein USB125703_01598 [Pseudoclavibacter triregionum]|nr:hypothetical protein USB125703_01598 [Pseudoclavibacter triregionum]
MALGMWWMPLLLAALALGVAVAAWMLVRHRRRDGAVPIANSERLTHLPGYRRALGRSGLRLGAAAVVLAILLGVTSIAAARWIYQRVETPEKFNRDIVLCLDVSGSMVDYDVKVLERYDEMLSSFEGERISLVLWDATAVPVFPLTDDYGFVREQLDAVMQSMKTAGADGGEYSAGTRNGAGASLVGDGLASCALMFGPAADDGRSRSIIFATDNAVNGDALVSLPEAVKIAADRRIVVYGLDANEHDNAFSDEYRTNVEANGGSYFKLADPGSVQSIVDAITSEQTSVIHGAPIVLITDRPAGWLIAMLVALAGYLWLAWRSKL